MNELLEALQKISKMRPEEPPTYCEDPQGYSGGNYNDAYNMGIRYGEEHAKAKLADIADAAIAKAGLK